MNKISKFKFYSYIFESLLNTKCLSLKSSLSRRFINRTESFEKLSKGYCGEPVVLHVFLIYNLLDLQVFVLGPRTPVGDQLPL